MLLCYYAILHLSIAWGNFLFLYQKHPHKRRCFAMQGSGALSVLFPLFCLVCLWVGELAHHGQHQVDADDGSNEPSTNDAEV